MSEQSLLSVLAKKNLVNWDQQMSWFGNTLLPVIEDTWFDREPPTEVREAAEEIRKAGHPDVASYVARLSSEDFENLVWQVTCSRQQNQEWDGIK